jgi:hypothetical protein
MSPEPDNPTPRHAPQRGVAPRHFRGVRYTSGVPYVAERIQAAAVYCSDGRVGEHFDDFLTHGLGLPRYDRIALPGGPACLAGHDAVKLRDQGVASELRFLVEAHELDRIVLIAHAGCAFYGERLGLPGDALELQQRTDLAKAAAFIRRVTHVANIEAYFATPDNDQVNFSAVALGD